MLLHRLLHQFLLIDDNFVHQQLLHQTEETTTITTLQVKEIQQTAALDFCHHLTALLKDPLQIQDDQLAVLRPQQLLPQLQRTERQEEEEIKQDTLLTTTKFVINLYKGFVNKYSVLSEKVLFLKYVI